MAKLQTRERHVEDAVLLVAGMGTRLRPYTNEIPKCLVEVAGTPLIVRLLRQLATHGIKRAWMVTGYKSEILEEHLKGVDGLPKLLFVHNDAFDSANNAESLRRAMLEMDRGAFLLCDGDILVDDDGWLYDLITDPRPNVLAVLLQLKSQLGEEEMKFQLEPVDAPWFSRRVVGLSKKLQPHMSHGESIGAQVIGKETFDALLERLNSMSPEERKDAYYEDMFAELFDDGHEFYTLAIRPGTWTEIDTPEDLEDAQKMMQQARASGVA